MTLCDKCSKKSKFRLNYGPMNFCSDHFNSFFKQRFKKTIRKYNLLKKKDVVVLGVSGGKDSMTALHLLNKFFSKEQTIKALMIDEGIPNYRDKALKLAKKEVKKLGIEFKEISFKERLGKTMIDVMKKTGRKKLVGSTCAFCGPFRRKLLNEGTIELHGTKMATGHNLDDEIQSITMNFFDNDLKRMSGLGPITQGTKQLIQRIKPLYLSPEKEIIAFAELNEINYFKEHCCPFSWQAKRNEFRGMLNQMENKFPGTFYSILSAFENMNPLLKDKFKEENYCQKCGSSSSGKICAACMKLKKLS